MIKQRYHAAKVAFPDGHVDNNWGKPHRVKVLSEAITGEETSILHQNVLGGTAVKSAIGCPTAAKTGTTTELEFLPSQTTSTFVFVPVKVRTVPAPPVMFIVQ